MRIRSWKEKAIHERFYQELHAEGPHRRAIPGTNNMVNTIRTKIDKYRELAEEIQRTWRTRTKILPIVITATGVVPAKTVENMQQLGGTGTEMRAMQKAVILHTTRIVRKVIGGE